MQSLSQEGSNSKITDKGYVVTECRATGLNAGWGRGSSGSRSPWMDGESPELPAEVSKGLIFVWL